MEQLFVIERVDSRTDQAVKALVELWEASVRATHDFLTEADIQALIDLCSDKKISRIKDPAVVKTPGPFCIFSVDLCQITGGLYL